MNIYFFSKKTGKTAILFLGLLVLLLLSYPALAKTYQIQDFSNDYHAVIKTTDSDDSDSNSVINIIDAKTKQTLISQPATLDIKYELENSQARQLGEKISANIVSTPYGEHSVLVYDDFNFDGRKDIALQDGRYGCYGGPSYQVYLKQGNTFVHSDGFTELAQGYCGFFGVDEETQTLSTMTKSGAAWHQYSEYKVINNKPVATHILEEEYNSRELVSITEKTRVNGEMLVDEYEILSPYDGTPQYIYLLTIDNGKKMVIHNHYKDGGKQLYYAFADKEGRIELFYDGPFIYDANKKTLSFTNKPVVYQINDQGIKVRTSNKTVQLKSLPNSVQGSLDEVGQFENVRIK